MKPSILLITFVILLFAFFARFYQLVQFPPGLTIDEVAIGFNAYSILKTGKDEWGNFLPLSFRSVGDYKAPILIYLTIPFVALFGETELAVRLPVAISSLISVFIIALLVRELFGRSFKNLPWLGAMVLAVSPWHLVYSRSSFEAILAVNFYLLNFLFALKFIKNKQSTDLFYTLLFAFLSLFTYHSNKVFIPLFNLSLIWIYKQDFLSWLKTSTRLSKVVILTTVLSMFTLFAFSLISGGSARAQMTVLSHDFEYARVLLPHLDSDPLKFLTEKLLLGLFWFKRYLEYFSPEFYLTHSLSLSFTSHPSVGVLYLVEFLLLGFGLFHLLKTKNIDKRIRTLLIASLLLGFLPASLANNSQHPLRSLNSLPTIVILISLGIYSLFSLTKSRLIHIILITILCISYFWGIGRFLDYYLVHYPQELSEQRSYGWKEIALFATTHATEYQNVYVDHRFGTEGPYIYGTPHLYFLFYSKKDPAAYLADPRHTQSNSNYDNFYFQEINWPSLNHQQKNLYIGSPWSFPKEILTLDNIKYSVKFLNDKSGLIAVTDTN